MVRPILKYVDPFGVLSIVLPFLLYLLTLAPSVTFFDSGEFLAAIYSLGSAHSPGYPLFINFCKPFTYLPLGNIAFRVNVATAFSASLACFGVYLLVWHLLKGEQTILSPVARQATALAAALTFAFTPRLWLQSNHDKPYPLVAFVAALVIYLLFKWRERYLEGEERPAYVYLGAFLSGLAFGAHQTMVLMVPAFIFLIVSVDWRLVTRIKEIIIAVAFGLLGFSIYLHLPVRAVTNPLMNWGDPKTLTQFLWHFLRKGYPVEKPDRGLELLWKQVMAFNIPNEFTVVGLALMLLGIVAFARKRGHEITAFGLAVLTFLAVIAGYFNTPEELIFLTEEFFTPLYLLAAVLVGLGLFAILKWGTEMLAPQKLRSLPVVVSMAAILFVLPTTLCLSNYYENDQHNNYIAYDYAMNTFRSLPEGAVLFTWGDSGAFPLWYLQGVERMREDLDLLHTPHLVFGWYLDAFPHLFRNSMLRMIPPEQQYPDVVLKLAIAEQLPRRPAFIDFSTRYSIPFNEYALQQAGICYQLKRAAPQQDLEPDTAVWELYSQRGLVGDDMPFRDLDTGKAILIYANTRAEVGEYLVRSGRVSEGIYHLQKAAALSPEMAEQVSRMLGGGR